MGWGGNPGAANPSSQSSCALMNDDFAMKSRSNIKDFVEKRSRTQRETLARRASNA
jgi:hypothetical protein